MVLAFSEGFGSALGKGAGAIAAYTALGLVLLLIGFFAVDVTTPGRLTAIIKTGRNANATLLAVCGMAGVGLVVAASIFASGGKLLEGLIATLVWGLVGIIAQQIATLLVRALLGVDVAALMTKEKLEPSAILLGATQVTIGLITAIAVI
jgi:fructose-1,6-bisphosphatase/sedoheptulose 1,7-bisphosphatase-like protein